jgi:large subunit ribosomal protein L19e
MNLRNKKQLAAKALHVGKERIIFVKERLEEIKEAITKQDIRDLHQDRAILVKEIKGRKTKPSKHKRKTKGNVRKKVNKRKQEYVIMTRKLRSYLAEMKRQGKVNPKELKEIRKKIRNRTFKSKSHLKDYLGGNKYEGTKKKKKRK